MAKLTAERYYDFSSGHRVHGHESKCAHLHGHNYRITFTIESDEYELNSVGHVMDFGAIKSLLCDWIEENWDHKFLIWSNDPCAETLKQLDPEGVVTVAFNTTAENMGKYLMEVVAPVQLDSTGFQLVKVRVEETRNCSVEVLK